ARRHPGGGGNRAGPGRPRHLPRRPLRPRLGAPDLDPLCGRPGGPGRRTRAPARRLPGALSARRAMAVLIFRRKMHGQDPLPYARWLRDLDEPLVLFTTCPAGDEQEFAHVERRDSFDADGLVELDALELDRRFVFTRIFAQSEHDLVRAADLRAWLGLPGQSRDSARAFRDKVTMKTLARAGGMETAAFAA